MKNQFNSIYRRVAGLRFNSLNLKEYLFVFVSLCFVPQMSWGGLLWIIHTNDLHSHFDHSTNPHRGGYAAVKAVIERLKAQAARLNIETLVLDAGDFMEGGTPYFADGGVSSAKIMNDMGYDAIALGNHDWLMGAQQLDVILGRAQFRPALLAANFRCREQFSQIRTKVQPFARFEKGHGAARVSIAVLGLTTDEANYAWRVHPECEVSSPEDAARQWIPRLKQNHQFVFALSHMGEPVDRKVISRTRGLDLVLGGHTHLAFKDHVRNEEGKFIPLVHAGKHGELVGSLLVDLYPGSPMEILDYRQIPVVNTRETPNETIVARIAEAHQKLENRYSKEWLDEVVGVSMTPLRSPQQTNTEWGDFIAESFRAAAGAQIGINVTRFNGHDRAAGVVRRRDLMALYPRAFETEKKLGWDVWRVRVPGFFIYSSLSEIVEKEMSFSASGLDVRTEFNPRTGKFRLKDLFYQGRRLGPFDEFILAVPEGLVRGGLAVKPVLGSIVLRQPRSTGISIWSALEMGFRRRSGYLSGYSLESPQYKQTYFNPDHEI